MSFEELDRIFEIRILDLRKKQQKSFSLPNVPQFNSLDADKILKRLRRELVYD